MHELGIAEALLVQARRELGDELRRAVTVHVAVGADRRVVDDALLQGWAVVRDDADLPALDLAIEQVPGGDIRVTGVTFADAAAAVAAESTGVDRPADAHER